MKYSLVVFDMDGTILDTLEDLADSLNLALSDCGFPLRTMEEVRSFVGNGIRKLIERGVPDNTPTPETERVYERFAVHYKTHCADKTRPYAGVTELIKRLRKAGLKTAVVSNKADPAVKELVRFYFDGLFDCALGEVAGLRRKPHPDLVVSALKELSETSENAVYVGDSEVDIQTAKSAFMDSIIVDWGFRTRDFLKSNGASVVVSTPEEVAEIILNGGEKQ